MNKWLAFGIFYIALGLSLAFYSPWIGAVWLLPILALYLLSWVNTLRETAKMRRLHGNDWQPTARPFSFLPKSARDWVMGEGKYGPHKR